MSLPDNKIFTVKDFKDAIFLQSECACTNPEHSHHIVVEVENYAKDDVCITTSIYQSLEWADYSFQDAGIFTRIARRIVNATKYLFSGRVMVEGHFVFDNDNHARDYANAILNSLSELKKRYER